MACGWVVWLVAGLFVATAGARRRQPAVPRLTRAEAAHLGQEFVRSDVVGEFAKAKTANAVWAQALTMNDFAVHHRIVRTFCEDRGGCKWQEYYDVLDAIREPFASLYDPGAGVGISASHHANTRECKRVESVTAKEFLHAVETNTPLIITKAAHTWKARDKWTFEHLTSVLRGTEIVTSVAPHGRYDTPEDAHLWDPSARSRPPSHPSAFNATDHVVIARPGHVQLDFARFVELLQSQELSKTASVYLEYFPLLALAKTTRGAKLLDDLGSLDFANFLVTRFRLIWMGSGTTVGSLHFDRNENLMAVMRGKKTFVMVDPSQSAKVYGGSKLRYAPYDATLNPDNTISFSRDPKKVQGPVGFNVYSPVNISAPNDPRFPNLRDVNTVVCEVNEGEVIYVPSEWWHEVWSEGDAEGKAIGINFFFEPFYERPAHDVLSTVLVANRFYHHLNTRSGMGLVEACEADAVCFAPPNKDEERQRRSSRKKRQGKRRKAEL